MDPREIYRTLLTHEFSIVHRDETVHAICKSCGGEDGNGGHKSDCGYKTVLDKFERDCFRLHAIDNADLLERIHAFRDESPENDEKLQTAIDSLRGALDDFPGSSAEGAD